MFIYIFIFNKYLQIKDIKDNFINEKDKGLEYLNGQMVIIIKVIGKMIKCMVKENFLINYKIKL